MSDPIVITREIVKRGWTDFEPKVITGLLTGGVATFITSVLGQYGIHLDATTQKLVVVACYFLGSYLTPSTGQTFTRTISKDIQGLVQQVEQHTGATVTTVTGPVPIQQSAPQPTVPKAAVNTGKDSVDQILTDAPHTDPAVAPTQVIRTGSQFLSNLGSTKLTSED